MALPRPSSEEKTLSHLKEGGAASSSSAPTPPPPPPPPSSSSSWNRLHTFPPLNLHNKTSKIGRLHILLSFSH